MGHLVGHGPVDLVTEAGDQRHGHGGDGPGDALGVEGGQVGLGPAAPDEGDDVGRCAGSMASSARHDRRLGVPALDPDVDQGHLEAQPAGPQLVQEVLGRRTAPAGQHGDPQRRADQWAPAVGGQEALLGQRLHDPVPLGGEQAHGVVGVDGGHAQLDLAGALVGGDLAPQADAAARRPCAACRPTAGAGR